MELPVITQEEYLNRMSFLLQASISVAESPVEAILLAHQKIETDEGVFLNLDAEYFLQRIVN